jgi:hypothetical protein
MTRRLSRRNPDHREALLHLYAQASWHRPAYLVGTPAGLTLLRDTLTALLASPATEATLRTCTADGRAYRLDIASVSPEGLQEYTLPYAGWLVMPEDV